MSSITSVDYSFIVHIVSGAVAGILTYLTTKYPAATVLATIIAFSFSLVVGGLGKPTITDTMVAIAFGVVAGLLIYASDKKIIEKVLGMKTDTNEKPASEYEKECKEISKKLDEVNKSLTELNEKVDKGLNTLAGYLLELENKIDDSYKKLNGGIWTVIGLLKKSGAQFSG